MWGWGRGAEQRPADPSADWNAFLDVCRSRILSSGADGDAGRAAALIDSAISPQVGAHRAAIVAAAVAELTGYGVLDPLLARDDVSEIMVNGCDRIWIEVAGRLQRTDTAFAGEGALLTVIERMASGVGRHIDAASPILDARLADGTRINAVIPPVSAAPLLTVRRFGRQRPDFSALMAGGMMTPVSAAFLHAAVAGRCNILISGAASTGKTTLLRALAQLVDDTQRIVVVEDVAELCIDHPNAVSQESRVTSAEGMPAIGLGELVRNALRMRPDRVVVGEVRGGEVVEMVKAMHSGHAGSMTTIHANSCEEALVRLETLLATTVPGVEVSALRRWLASAVDVVVQCRRLPGGTREVAEIAAVELTDDGIELVEILPGSVSRRALPVRCLRRMADHGVVFPLDLLRTAQAA